MPMTQDEVKMLQDIVERIRDEFASAVYIEAVKRWSPASVRTMLKDAVQQVSKIDEEMIRIAFSDFDQAADNLELQQDAR